MERLVRLGLLGRGRGDMATGRQGRVAKATILYSEYSSENVGHIKHNDWNSVLGMGFILMRRNPVNE